MTAIASVFRTPAAALTEVAPRVIKPLQFDYNTVQTLGMHRLAAVSGLLAGSEHLWAGVMMAEPGTASSIHHHGPQETVVYVAEGRSLLRWGHRMEHESELEAGDFLFLPPYLPHQEINPSPDQPATWIVVRSGPEAVVVDLAPDADGKHVPPGSIAIKPSAPIRGATSASRRNSPARPRTEDGRGKNPRLDRIESISFTLLALSVAVFVGVVISESWLWAVRSDWLTLLPVAMLALLGVIDVAWAFHARSARRLALLDAYAEREMARSSARRRQ